MSEYPELMHYSARPVARVLSKKQPIDEFFKPVGLWVSDDSAGEGWFQWCRDESYAVHRLACRHRVTIAPGANVLWLKSCADIDAFTKRFDKTDTLPFSYSHIDWPAVAQEYQGILITPYQWDRRFCDRSRWYYSWDCASGCIWDADAIAEIKLLTVQEAA